MTSLPAADVGRWFSASRGPGPTAWGPLPSRGYGLRSGPEVLRAGRELLRPGPIAVLTGAGMSTLSGLPDYRGADATPRSPMTYQEFVSSDLARRRYWARSTVGWEQFGAARPNDAHLALARLAEHVEVSAVITQNVDGLHQRAGSSPVIDLHGRLDRVRCLGCGALSSREMLHSRLLMANPEVAADLPRLAAQTAQAPDGDAEVDRTSSFRYPPCPLCGGILKPDVVFFGESAHAQVVREAFAAVRGSSALLVLGSSLTVRSGLRFVREARRLGRAVVIVNDGPTRGDDLADVRVHGRLEEVLSAWAAELGAASAAGA